jgi:hypothetical protein
MSAIPASVARLTWLLALLATVAAGAVPAPAGAQILPQAPPAAFPAPTPAPRDRAEIMVGVLAVNATLGAATAALARLTSPGDPHRRDAVLKGMGWGALGGSLSFAGKFVASGGARHGGIAGRQIAAVGSSIVHGAAFGSSALEQVVVPLGPIRLYARTAEAGDSGRTVLGRKVRAKLDAAGFLGLTYELARSDSRFDVAESLRSGAPVFQSANVPTGAVYRGGEQYLGVVWLIRDPDRRDLVLRHERVHVIQYDQRFIFWGARLDQAVLGSFRHGERIARWIDLGLIEMPWAAATRGMGYERRPAEREAHLLSEERRHEARTGGMPRR